MGMRRFRAVDTCFETLQELREAVQEAVQEDKFRR